jgi:hypothetical protein
LVTAAATFVTATILAVTIGTGQNHGEQT